MSEVVMINADKTSSVLEALENNGLHIDSCCRGGFCGVCRVKLISGEFEYKENPIGYCADDEILSCCCMAKTELKIKV